MEFNISLDDVISIGRNMYEHPPHARFTVVEVADMFHMSRGAVYHHIRKGTLTTETSSQPYKFTPDNILKFCDYVRTGLKDPKTRRNYGIAQMSRQIAATIERLDTVQSTLDALQADLAALQAHNAAYQSKATQALKQLHQRIVALETIQPQAKLSHAQQFQSASDEVYRKPRQPKNFQSNKHCKLIRTLDQFQPRNQLYDIAAAPWLTEIDFNKFERGEGSDFLSCFAKQLVPFIGRQNIDLNKYFDPDYNNFSYRYNVDKTLKLPRFGLSAPWWSTRYGIEYLIEQDWRSTGMHTLPIPREMQQKYRANNADVPSVVAYPDDELPETSTVTSSAYQTNDDSDEYDTLNDQD